VRVLYLSYTGLLEPLGQSQVLAYLRLLSRKHSIGLITFEKPGDLADVAAMEAQRRTTDALGIRWIPLRYHQHPRLLATGWDLLAFAWSALRVAHQDKVEVLHCRSYIPSFVALAVKWLARKPFVFDMRALWPEEMVAAGRLNPGSLVYRILQSGERLCLKQAAAVVSLTETGVAHIRHVYGHEVEAVDFAVIPTCVDLDLFRPALVGAQEEGRALAIGSVGTVLSGWFKFDWLTAFFSAADELVPDLDFKIVTPEDSRRIRALAEAGGTPPGRLEIYGAGRLEVPEAIGRLSAVAMFYATGAASTGRCPTRMGEVLACGIPVVVNAGVGDVEGIVRRYDVGVVVNDASAQSMRAAAVALIELLQDPQLRARCRHAAESWFSLERGAELYDQLYSRVAASRANPLRTL